MTGYPDEQLVFAVELLHPVWGWSEVGTRRPFGQYQGTTPGGEPAMWFRYPNAMFEGLTITRARLVIYHIDGGDPLKTQEFDPSTHMGPAPPRGPDEGLDQ